MSKTSLIHTQYNKYLLKISSYKTMTNYYWNLALKSIYFVSNFTKMSYFFLNNPTNHLTGLVIELNTFLAKPAVSSPYFLLIASPTMFPTSSLSIIILWSARWLWPGGFKSWFVNVGRDELELLRSLEMAWQAVPWDFVIGSSYLYTNYCILFVH